MGHSVEVKVSAEGDDWETDPDFEVAFTSWDVSCGADGGHSLFLSVSERRVRAGAEMGSEDHRGVRAHRAHQVGDLRAPGCDEVCSVATGRGSETQAVKHFLIWLTQDDDANGTI